jgi:hypothetical protein
LKRSSEIVLKLPIPHYRGQYHRLERSGADVRPITPSLGHHRTNRRVPKSTFVRFQYINPRLPRVCLEFPLGSAQDASTLSYSARSIFVRFPTPLLSNSGQIVAVPRMSAKCHTQTLGWRRVISGCNHGVWQEKTNQFGISPCSFLIGLQRLHGRTETSSMHGAHRAHVCRSGKKQ